MDNNEIRISVRVRPGAHNNEIGNFTNDILQVKVAAPPVRGKANRELIAFLSEILGVDKSRINIIKGETSYNKIIAVRGLSEGEVMKRLNQPPAEELSSK